MFNWLKNKKKKAKEARQTTVSSLSYSDEYDNNVLSNLVMAQTILNSSNIYSTPVERETSPVTETKIEDYSSSSNESSSSSSYDSSSSSDSSSSFSSD